MTSQRLDRREWLVRTSALLSAGCIAPLAAQGPAMVVRDEGVDGIAIIEQGVPVLRYRYVTVPIPGRDGSPSRPPGRPSPPALTPAQAESMRRYGHPRSNYIHPLYGLDGTPLTDDWSVDHPHHRGIYWAWPEVGYKGELGDLHALQRVFARPTGRITAAPDNAGATIEAENEWRWDDVTPIVRETARIHVHRRAPVGRLIDLHFTFVAIADDVTIARRQTNAYGGLNTRLAPVADLRLAHHADPPAASPRMAWQSASGTWHGAAGPASLTILEAADNPGYPGDYIEFPELPWFQPTFPAPGTRHTLTRTAPLDLRYRLWVREGGAPSEGEYREQWDAYQER